MKNKHLLYFAAFVTLCLTSCSKPQQEETPDTPILPTDTTIVGPVTPIDTVPTPIIIDSLTVKLNFKADGNVDVVNPKPDSIEVIKESQILTITSTAHGMSYKLQGTSSDVTMHLKTTQAANILFDGVTLSSSAKSRIIDIESEERCVLIANDSTANTLNDTSSDADTTKACIYSSGELAITGEGTLNVNSTSHHGIRCESGVSVSSGNYTFVTGKDGIHSHEFLYIKGGSMVIDAATDGLQAKDGYVSIDGGAVNITTSNDKAMGIKADGNIYINGGKLTVNVKGAASKAIKCDGDMAISGGETTITTSGGIVYDDEVKDFSSSAGIKCDGLLKIEGQATKLNITSSGKGGKGINVAGNIIINNGDIQVVATGAIASDTRLPDSTSSPKAIKCDKAITINAGTVYAQSNYSNALEAVGNINLIGGNIKCFGSSDEKKYGVKTDGKLYILTNSSPTVWIMGNKNTKPSSAITSQCSISLIDKVHTFAEGGTLGMYQGTNTCFECTLPISYTQNRAHIVYSAPSCAISKTYDFKYNGNTIKSFVTGATLNEVKVE